MPHGGFVHHLVFAVYLLLTAFAFARVEIEIEGPHGWAANLPTWRINNKWTKILCGSRPLTGYHFWLQVFVILMAHLPFGFQFWQWSIGAELEVIGFVILFFITEDFLWFVMNPAYGLRRFRRENIWWHEAHWWWIMPRDYWVFFCLGTGMYVYGCWLR
jgi:hypothetical protein